MEKIPTRADLLRLPKATLIEYAEQGNLPTKDGEGKLLSRRTLAESLVPRRWKHKHSGPNRAERRARRRAGYNIHGKVNVPYETPRDFIAMVPEATK